DAETLKRVLEPRRRAAAVHDVVGADELGEGLERRALRGGLDEDAEAELDLPACEQPLGDAERAGAGRFAELAAARSVAHPRDLVAEKHVSEGSGFSVLLHE